MRLGKPLNNMYKIKINNMKFFSHIGVLPEEKILGQNLEIDLIVTTNFSYSGLDELDETSRADLIEKLAFDIIQAIKENNKVETVEVHVRKLAVPIAGIFDNVEIEMVG